MTGREKANWLDNIENGMIRGAVTALDAVDADSTTGGAVERFNACDEVAGEATAAEVGGDDDEDVAAPGRFLIYGLYDMFVGCVTKSIDLAND